MTCKTVFIVTNLMWLVGLLALSLIGSLSVGWASVEGLPNIISVALSLASLLLAIIAIVQSLVSGGDLNRSLSDIGRAAENVLTVSKALEVNTVHLGRRLEEFGSVPETLLNVKGQIEELGKRTQPFQANNSVQSSGEKSTVKPSIRADFDIKEAFDRTTYGSVAAAYCAVLGYKTKKKFTCVEINTRDGMYWQGALGGYKTVGLISYKNDSEGVLIDDCGPFTEDAVNDWFNQMEKSSKSGAVKYAKDNAPLILNFFYPDENKTLISSVDPEI